MSGVSRKVKNPLLSAAGEGFPYENYTENALFVPVTPASPAVLRDDAELDNFVGQEPINSNQPSLPATERTAPTDELTSVPLNSEDVKSTPSQPIKQGYFTSILSSLPNLSLSSITGESSVHQANEGVGNVANTLNGNFNTLSQDHRNNLQDAPPLLAADLRDPRRTNFLGAGEVNPGNISNLSTPPQPTLPPTAPSSDGPISYRLGNQRRLKYAPPPDLTSNVPKQYPTSAVQSFFSPQNVTASPTILNPYESTVPTQNYRPIDPPTSSNTPFMPPSTVEQLSQNNSLQGSFRSSPITTGLPYSSNGSPRSITPQSQNSQCESAPPSIRPAISLSLAKPIPSQIPDTATPQNTPANVSFPGFELYGNQRDFFWKTASDKETIPTNQTTSQSQISRDNTPGSNSEVRTEPLAPGCADVTFTPISAVKVSEKLEHLLAEQEEQPLNPPTEIKVKTDEDSAVESQIVQEVSDVKLNNREEQVDPPILESSTDLLHQQKAPELTPALIPEEVNTASAKVNAPENYNTSSSVPSFQHYYQPQTTLATGVDFFEEKQADTTFDVSSTPSTDAPTLTGFPHSTNTAEKSQDSFFALSGNAPSFSHFESNENKKPEYPAAFSSFPLNEDNRLGNVESFPPFQSNENKKPEQFEIFSSSETNNKIDLVPTYPASNLQQNLETSTYISNSVGSPQPVPQSLWNTSQTFYTETPAAANFSSNQPPPPLFFNPTQLQNEYFKQPPLPQNFPSINEQPIVTQTQQHFGNLPVSDNYYQTPQAHNTAFLPPTLPMATAVPEPTGSATLSPLQMSVNPLAGRSNTDTVPPSFQNLAANSTDKRMQYRAVYHHWFYRKEVEHKVLWLPFSMQDSLRLEEIHNSSEITPETTVAIDGGRYDVDILRRQKSPVYWTGQSTEVRRCSWFFKGPTESRYIPYDESTAAKLEEEYKQACLTNNWNRRIDLSNGEYIIFHSSTVQVHYSIPSSPELATSWGNSAGSEDSAYLQGAASRPRVIKRGLDEFHIEDGEPEKVDHLLFLVHGIGSVCDLKFRSVEEVVDEFRSISLQLVQSHYRTASEQRIVNRIEVLPISWHTTLHSEDTGIDKKLQAITLDSIPKLRHFTNDTLLDILFYTSPIYCQTIMQTVGGELNRLYALFKERNPDFDGGIYLGGHSLGSLILFDLLCHQKPAADESTAADDGEVDAENEDEVSDTKLTARVLRRRRSKKISYVMGAAGTGQPYIHYPQLNFHPRAFFALGSPIGMFVTVRGIDTLGEDFVLPTCPAFFNVFHPFDPVAYRVESLINPEAHKFRPMLIPHHKGRKRMHLELKETMARVGADLKQKLLDSVRNTWNSVYQLALFHKSDNHTLEREIDKVVEEQLQNTSTVADNQSNDDGGADFKVGQLNGGRRIDYVLQEAPFEYINEYIFALTSHVCYWESEDTMLMILKEIYGSEGIQTDAQLPQQTLSIERASPSPSAMPSPSTSTKGEIGSPGSFIGIDPLAPISEKPLGPPPKAGFVRKS